MDKEGLKENEREGIDRESKLGRGNTYKKTNTVKCGSHYTERGKTC
jgi:hypothetical protein